MPAVLIIMKLSQISDKLVMARQVQSAKKLLVPKIFQYCDSIIGPFSIAPFSYWSSNFAIEIKDLFFNNKDTY